NMLEITRTGGAAAYATKQRGVIAGRTYDSSLYFKNGTGNGRLFVGNTSLASGEYTGGTFVALNNAAWTKHSLQFVATTSNLFFTVQIASAAPATFNIDEIELRQTIPVYANNAAAISGGLAVGDVYRTGD